MSHLFQLILVEKLIKRKLANIIEPLDASLVFFIML